jgi:hypothetical protein
MNIRQLGHLLKKSHRKTRSWNKTGKAFHMSGGMAYRIAFEGYDPADPTLRNALGLGPRVCPKCQRKVTVPRVAPKRIFDMPANELLWRLQNRK